MGRVSLEKGMVKYTEQKRNFTFLYEKNAILKTDKGLGSIRGYFGLNILGKSNTFV